MELQIYSKKRPDFRLTTGLLYSEAKCKCTHEDCTFTLLNERLIRNYGIIRKYWGSAIGINSLFRCQRHNKNSGGARDSWHKKGSGIDIFPHNGKLEELYFLANKYFDLVIYYEAEGFIHCQMET